MENASDSAITAQNRRKIEKDIRRKTYHDTQVQGTNNSSIVSKRSVERLYNPVLEPNAGEWFKHFVPQSKRRSPAINRGYWLRMESISQAMHQIQRQHDTRIRVVNLGCGFDPLPFKTLSESNASFEFFDLDYPSLVSKKLSVIEQCPEILEVIGSRTDIGDADRLLGLIMATHSYKLIGCDLNDTELYKKQLDHFMNSSTPTIFIAEVSLAYMKPEHANPVVQLSSELPNSHFLGLEQIMPSGENHFFAQKMLYHFAHLRSPLQCVEKYPTKAKQHERFAAYYPSVEVYDLFECWSHLVSQEKKELVRKVEDFDEWEEFIVFCQHYVLIHSTNTKNMLLLGCGEVDSIPDTQPLNVTLLDCSVNLKFPACTSKSGGGSYVHGGMFQTRTDEIHLQDGASGTTKIDTSSSTNKPCARMCHTLTNLNNGKLLMVGGRTRPGQVLGDVWLFEEKNRQWHKVGEIEGGVARHSAVYLGAGSVLIYGNGSFWKVSVDGMDNYSCEMLRVEGQLPDLVSCGVSFDVENNVGYIVGGMVDEVGPTINDQLFRFSVHGVDISVQLVKVSPHFARIACLATVSRNKLYILGGAGKRLQNQSDVCITYDIAEDKFCRMSLSDEIWRTLPVFIGSQMAANVVLGGGAVCYSFGSCYSKGYIIELGQTA